MTTGLPPTSPDDEDGVRELHRCIRDLTALIALPSFCIGRSPVEAVDIVLDALPTALSCDLVYLALPGSPVQERAILHGVQVPESELRALAVAIDHTSGADGVRIVPGCGAMWCFEAEVPLGAEAGRLVAGRKIPLGSSSDRVLVRSAANLVGAALENARVLEIAGRKDEFLAVLGHELRNPLAPIATAVELLARHPNVIREQQVIERHLRHLSRLVDDLLDISRVTRGHVELRSEYLTLASVLDRAIEIATPVLTRQRHTLGVGTSEGITVKGDPVRLAQIFSNLLVNAAKFTPPGGKVDVEIDRNRDRVRVTVRDTGRGLPRDQLVRIFEPFVQANRERDALSGGLGLGLAIVKDLVARHGGSITAHSDGPGRGAAFTVELPTAAHAVEPKPIAPSHTPVARAGVRVLVVDDNFDIAELLSDALRIEGFQTAIEHAGTAALERWRTFLPHAAVLDVGLPDLDGYELARKLRVEHGTIPTLIAATGYGQPKDRLRATDAGFDCHFVKPVSVRDLVKVLDQRVVTASPGISSP